MGIHDAARRFVSDLSLDQIQKNKQDLLNEIGKDSNINALEGGVSAISILSSLHRDAVIASLGNRDGLALASGSLMEVFGAMLTAGADPWAGSPNMWDRDRLWIPTALCEALVAHERKTGVCQLGPNGQTHFHALLSRQDTLFSVSLPEHAPVHWTPTWLNAQDYDGNTPFHILWMSTPKDNLDEAAEASLLLVMHNARMDIRNNEGVSVAELIVGAPGIVQELGGEFGGVLTQAKTIAANLAFQDMNERTAPSLATRKAVRL